ncbi:het domain protein [Colletotrichum kahawae]|uniref:Het domain protein n=1 Tax=Colletotrichum kahawae TaxID=34407 RepID=A0AAE0D509_COLKA|nr:het domain protein [Colletotrichum kahawae]
MRLIEASSINSAEPLIKLVDFTPDQIPDYTILSHTWGSDEFVYADIRDHTAVGKPSFKKVRHSCHKTIDDGFQYVWIDSCCIDKSSSAELSEAINSMFDWYSNAKKCYAYLSDFSTEPLEMDCKFHECRWFTRGWTLQELIAPNDLIFFSKDWAKIGSKLTMSDQLSTITGIDEDILTGIKPIESASIAKRMSWAAGRETTRPEDIAYCLMGLFGVNMPMLYGEGDKAFLRLQEEIMRQSDDQSLFAWVDLSTSAETNYGLLAKSPLYFKDSHTVVPYQDFEPRAPYSMTNRGLQIDLPLTLVKGGLFAAALNCPAPPNYEDSSFLAIYLKRISYGDQRFARVSAEKFIRVQERGRKQTIFVRQNFNSLISSDGVFPQHILQLRSGPSTRHYPLIKVITSGKHNDDRPAAPLPGWRRGSDFLQTAAGQTIAFRSPKTPGKLAGAVVFSISQSEGSRLLIMFGSAESGKAGFHAKELPLWDECIGLAGKSSTEEHGIDFESLEKVFEPSQVGNDVELQHHRVRVYIEPVISHSCKYLMADLSVEPISRPGDAVQTDDTVISGQNRVVNAEPSDVTGPRHRIVSAWKKVTSRAS